MDNKTFINIEKINVVMIVWNCKRQERKTVWVLLSEFLDIIKNFYK